WMVRSPSRTITPQTQGAIPLLHSVKIPPGLLAIPCGGIHELLEKAGAAHPAPFATRLGPRVHLSRLPEALWRKRAHHRGLPGHWLADLRGLPHGRDRILRRNRFGPRPPHAHRGSALVARHGRG